MVAFGISAPSNPMLEQEKAAPINHANIKGPAPAGMGAAAMSMQCGRQVAINEPRCIGRRRPSNHEVTGTQQYLEARIMNFVDILCAYPSGPQAIG